MSFILIYFYYVRLTCWSINGLFWILGYALFQEKFQILDFSAIKNGCSACIINVTNYSPLVMGLYLKGPKVQPNVLNYFCCGLFSKYVFSKCLFKWPTLLLLGKEWRLWQYLYFAFLIPYSTYSLKWFQLLNFEVIKFMDAPKKV